MPTKRHSGLTLDLAKSGMAMKAYKPPERMPKPTRAQAEIVCAAAHHLDQGMFEPDPSKEAAWGILCDQISDWSWELCRESKLAAAKAMSKHEGDVDAPANEAQFWDDACEAAWRVKDALRLRKQERRSTVQWPLGLTKSTDNAYVTRSPQVAWRRVPGAASMLPNHVAAKKANEDRYLNSLYTPRGMPVPKPLISDGNFNTAADVVKGLGLPVVDENIWASRIGKMVKSARIETDLRKSLYATLNESKDELPKFVKSELARRALMFYREERKNRGDFFAKALPSSSSGKPLMGGGGGKPGGGAQKPQQQKPNPNEPERVDVAPPGKDVPDFEDKSSGGTPEQRKQKHFSDPAVDVGDLEAGPVDPGIITQEVEQLHQQLHALHAHMDGSPAEIHMHNDIVRRMREVYAKPDQDGLREVKHMLHHFAELVQGPPDPEMNDTGAGMGDGGGPPGAGKKPGAGGAGQKPGAGGGGPPRPGIPMNKSARPFR